MPILDRWQSLTAILAIPTVLMMQAGRTIPPSDAARQSEHLLSDIRRLAETRQSFSQRAYRHRLELRAAHALIETIARLDRHEDLQELNKALNAGDTTCAEPGSLLLSTNQALVNDNFGSVTFKLEGLTGAQQFTFASGTLQTNIVLAVNAFQDATGVEADVSELNENLIEVRSVERTSQAFVRVSQLSGPMPLIYTSLEDEDATFEEIGLGLDERLGDLDCDGAVTVVDLLQLIRAWGPCDTCVEDLDDSGGVNVLDLILLLSRWG